VLGADYFAIFWILSVSTTRISLFFWKAVAASCDNPNAAFYRASNLTKVMVQKQAPPAVPAGGVA
jgi:hypothetical protein